MSCSAAGAGTSRESSRGSTRVRRSRCFPSARVIAPAAMARGVEDARYIALASVLNQTREDVWVRIWPEMNGAGARGARSICLVVRSGRELLDARVRPAPSGGSRSSCEADQSNAINAKLRVAKLPPLRISQDIPRSGRVGSSGTRRVTERRTSMPTDRLPTGPGRAMWTSSPTISTRTAVSRRGMAWTRSTHIRNRSSSPNGRSRAPTTPGSSVACSSGRRATPNNWTRLLQQRMERRQRHVPAADEAPVARRLPPRDPKSALRGGTAIGVVPECVVPSGPPWRGANKRPVPGRVVRMKL